MDHNNEIGKRLKLVREALDLTKEEFGKEIGKSLNTVNSWVLERTSGHDITDLTRTWLTEKIGMDDSRWAKRSWVRPQMDAASIGFQTSARDLARFGLLMLAQGEWNGKVLLNDRNYLTRSIQPSQTMNPAYGYLWWLNGTPVKDGDTLDPFYAILFNPSAECAAVENAIPIADKVLGGRVGLANGSCHEAAHIAARGSLGKDADAHHAARHVIDNRR